MPEICGNIRPGVIKIWGVSNMAARGKTSKLLSFFRTFLTSFMVTTISSDRFDGGFWSVHKRREEAGIPFWRSMLANPTNSKFPLHSVCHICASQIFIYENLGNYFKNLWCCSNWCWSSFGEENRDLRVVILNRSPRPTFPKFLIFPRK